MDNTTRAVRALLLLWNISRHILCQVTPILTRTPIPAPFIPLAMIPVYPAVDGVNHPLGLRTSLPCKRHIPEDLRDVSAHI